MPSATATEHPQFWVSFFQYMVEELKRSSHPTSTRENKIHVQTLLGELSLLLPRGHRDKKELGCSSCFFIVFQEVAAIAGRRQFPSKGERGLQNVPHARFQTFRALRQLPLLHGGEQAFAPSALQLSWSPSRTEPCLRSQHSCFLRRVGNLQVTN